MRIRTTPVRRPTASARAATALRAGTLGLTFSACVFTTGVANAATTATDADTMSFGVLGPVGLGAVALGIVGMALGVVRQRRKAAQEAALEAEQAPVAPVAPMSAEEMTRPLTPYRRNTL